MANEQLRGIILGVVETQITSNDPPIVGQTLARLVEKGYTRDESVRLIGAALAEEIYEILSTHKSHDAARYEAALNSIE